MTPFLLMLLVSAADPDPLVIVTPDPKPIERRVVVVAADDYASVREKVQRGATYTIYAGVPLPTNAEPNAVRIDEIPGEPAGVYDCFRGANGEPAMVARVAAVPAARVAAPEPAAVTMVKGHQHTCPKCKTTWEHADNDKSASHVCPNCNTVVTKKSGSVMIPVEVKPVIVPAKPKRISLNGRWYDRYPDGTLVECKP